MFIALVGGRGSGKGTVQDYFVNRHGFRVIGVGESQANLIYNPLHTTGCSTFITGRKWRRLGRS
jgi:hypothetical protein